MLAQGKVPNASIATEVGAGYGHSRRETDKRLRYKACKGDYFKRGWIVVLIVDKHKKPLPVVTFDRSLKQVIKTWPDGRVEIVPQSIRNKSSKE